MSKASGDTKITIEQIAQDLGCSKTTVSRALSGNGRVGKEMQKKILAYCKRIGYQKKETDVSDETFKTYNIGVFLPADQELNEIPFFQQCLMGICETAASKLYEVLVIMLEANDLSRVKRVVQENKVDGMIVTRALTNDPVIQYLESEHVPLAVIGEVKGHEALYVDDDTVEACMQMTDYLLGRRINRMALIGGNEQHTVTQKRLRGFERAHEIYHKKIPQDLVYLNCATKADVFAAVEELAEKCVECIVCMDDKICSHVLMKLNRMHLSIPKDIKVVSFYDSFFLQNYIPPVTAISFDEQELGRLACEKLIGWLESEDAGEKISPGFDLVLRASTKM